MITLELLRKVVRDELRRAELIRTLQERNRLVAEACSRRNIYDPNGEADLKTYLELLEEHIKEDLEELKRLEQ